MTTIRLLDETKLQNVTMYVPEMEIEEYQSNWPNTDFVAIPKESFPGIRTARQIALEDIRNEGYPFVWMLDDDIKVFYNKGKRCTARAALSSLEAISEPYSNVAVTGISSEDNGKLFDVNANLQRGIMLVNLNTKVNFSDDLCEVYEDIAFELRNAENGYVILGANGFSFENQENLPGGASGLYMKGESDKAAQYLLDLYPTDVKSEPMPFPFLRKPIILWDNIETAIQSKAVAELTGDKE
jgi:hypothetical protein